MLTAVLIAVVVTLLLSFCIAARAWMKKEYGVVIMAMFIFTLMLCSLPIIGKLMV